MIILQLNVRIVARQKTEREKAVRKCVMRKMICKNKVSGIKNKQRETNVDSEKVK